MATLAELKTEIAGDLHRDDQTANIARAITAAIQHHERTRWWFLEGRATTSTVNDQTFYDVPTDLLAFDTLLVTLSGSRDRLRQVNYKTIDEEDTGVYTGTPTQWAYYGDQIRLYPTPNDVYVLTLSYHKSLVTLADGESNAWTTDAKELIRHRAVWDIYQNKLKSPEAAMLAKQSEEDARMSLDRINRSRMTSGRLKKSGW